MLSLHQVLQAVVGSAYQIQRELPGAGMSRVFLAREPALHRDVVIKVLPPDLVSSSSLQRFTREIQVTARLQHPYILPVITAGGNDELRYYVTPFIRGESLRARLASEEPLSFADAVRIADQLLQAIAFAHGRDVVHRDIKPGNILLSEGHAILADFGIASIAKGEHASDHADHMSGSSLDSTRVYVAPEQPRGEPRDLFAAAVVIHEMVLGVPGVVGMNASAIAAAVRARHPQAAAADVRRLAGVLNRALASDPAARFATADAMRGAIHSINRGPRRHVAASIAAAGAAAADIVIAAFVLSPEASASDPVAPPGMMPADTAESVVMQGGETDSAISASPQATVEAMAPLDSARLLFHAGELGAATSLYQLAAKTRAADPHAHLGVAITTGMLDTPADRETSRAAAQRALRDSASLDAHDRALAHGFIALADARFPEACAAFDRARQAKPSFEAWFGLAECRMRDDLVITDSAGNPQFRSGRASAFAAYANAVRVLPMPVAYRRMALAVPQTGSDVRVGRSADNRVFAGNWRLFDDTVGFVLGQSGAPRRITAETFIAANEAARKGREMLRPLLLAWVRQSPDDPLAHETLAGLLEQSDVIAHVDDDRVSALGEIELARSLEQNPRNAARLAAMHARLLLRARRFEELSTLADSMLLARGDGRGFEEQLLPVSILTGRIDRASAMLSRVSGTSNRAVRGPDGRPALLPPAIVGERADFLVRASLGVCDSRVRSGPERMLDQLDAAFPGGVPRGVESGFMERVVLLALPCLGHSVVETLREPGSQLSFWARAFDPADATFPRDFRARFGSRLPLPPGAEPNPEVVVVEALGRIAMKDSTGALETLKLALDRLPFLNRGSLTSEWSVGSTVRGMTLAAELAFALGDHGMAQRWAPGAAALLRHADPELQPVAARMREIAARTTGRE